MISEKVKDELAPTPVLSDSLYSKMTLGEGGIWAAVGIIFLSAQFFLLSLAGIHVDPFPEVITPLHPTSRGAAITGAAGLLAGAIGLITFRIGYHQKNRVQDSQNRTVRAIAEENRLKQNEWEENRLKEQGRIEQEPLKLQNEWEQLKLNQQRSHFEFDAISKQYDALSKDFYNADPLAQINASIGLVAIAKTPDPTRLYSEGLTKAPQTHLQEYYPWFKKVAMQLASALNAYDEVEPRSQVRTAIRELRDFSTNDPENPFLIFLVHQLADANRAAYDAFLNTLAEGFACNSESVDSLASCIRIFPRKDENRIAIEGLLAKPDFVSKLESSKVKRAHWELHNSQEDQRQHIDDKYLLRLEISSLKLAATRDAIFDTVSFFRPEIKTKKRPYPRLVLSYCFLQGGEIRSGSFALVAADYAQFQGTNFWQSGFGNNVFRGCNFDNANFRHCEMYEVDLIDCNIAGTRFFSSYPHKVRFARTNWKEIDFNEWVWSETLGKMVRTEREDLKLRERFETSSQANVADFELE